MNGIIIKIEAMKRIIQALTLPTAEHQRENMELSATQLSAIISRSVAHQMK